MTRKTGAVAELKKLETERKNLTSANANSKPEQRANSDVHCSEPVWKASVPKVSNR